MKFYRIAFLNPYLPGGHTSTAEIESTARLIQAAKNINAEMKVFGTYDDIEFYKPDFVISISYQTPKLTSFPTYLTMDAPVSFIRDVPRFVRNVLSYDGFMTISETTANWIREICLENNKKAHIAHAGVSVPFTDFLPGDYANAVAMYLGTNWDGLRHKNLFELLAKSGHIKCYGPKKSWEQYPSSLYGGEVPFDGYSSIGSYRKSAAGLCIGHPAFDNEGVPSSRTYEIAAASALPICSNTSLNKKIYGDSVLYVDCNAPTEELANQIIDRVKWIRSNPEKAQEMSRQAHEIFNTSLSLEYFLSNLIKMHEDVLVNNKYISDSVAQGGEAVCYILVERYLTEDILPLLKNILNQSHKVKLLVISDNGLEFNSLLADSTGNLSITFMPHSSQNLSQDVFNYLKESHIDWFGILTSECRLFSNHTAQLLDAYLHACKKGDRVSCIYGDSLENSNIISLPELRQDVHIVKSATKIRMANPVSNRSIPLHSLLINFNTMSQSIFACIDFHKLDASEILNKLMQSGILLRQPEITSSLNIDKTHIPEKIQELEHIVHEQSVLIRGFQSQLKADELEDIMNPFLISLVRRCKRFIKRKIAERPI